MIDEDLLLRAGAVYKSLKAKTILLGEGEEVHFYYKVVVGLVKLNNYNDKGKEMIQRICGPSDDFGTPALLGSYPACSNVEAIVDTKLLCLSKSCFYDLIGSRADLAMKILKDLAHKFRYRTMIAKEINCSDSEQRIIALFKYMKQNSNCDGEIVIDYTRQTIANLIGLRVETVIRTIKSLEKNSVLRIENGKVYY